ncbi:MAG: MFS transporter [Ktedonobacterales bacterium]|nr:MFS transporter [Ktedonobacterales bacterium]
MPTTAASQMPTRSGSDFWKYWTGQTISNLGSSFTEFALPLLVFKLTGSALNLGITTAATFIPYLLFGLLIGAWVDRVNRKRLMIVTDILRALVIASIPLMAALRLLTVEWIYGVAFASSTLTICFNSAEFAAIPSLVSADDLVTANGRIQASYSGAAVAGPLLAGLLITLLPLSNVLLADAASFLLSSASLGIIRTSFNQSTPSEKTHILRDIVEGLRYVLRHPVLRNISAMMALVNLVGNAATAQIIFFAKRQLTATDAQVALLYSAGSVGVVVLSLLAGPLRKRWSFSVVALGALMLNGLLLVVFAFQRNIWAALPIWALDAGLGILFNINTGSLRQAIVPNHLLGRVISIAGVLAWSAIPIGAVAGGFAVQRSGNVVLVFAVVGVLTFLIPLAFSFSPLGHADRYLPQPVKQPLTASGDGARV